MSLLRHCIRIKNRYVLSFSVKFKSEPNVSHFYFFVHNTDLTIIDYFNAIRTMQRQCRDMYYNLVSIYLFQY